MCTNKTQTGRVRRGHVQTWSLSDPTSPSGRSARFTCKDSRERPRPHSTLLPWRLAAAAPPDCPGLQQYGRCSAGSRNGTPPGMLGLQPRPHCSVGSGGGKPFEGLNHVPPPLSVHTPPCGVCLPDSEDHRDIGPKPHTRGLATPPGTSGGTGERGLRHKCREPCPHAIALVMNSVTVRRRKSQTHRSPWPQ